MVLHKSEPLEDPAPPCSNDHGLMVPCEVTFGLLDAEGAIIATVAYLKQAPDWVMRASVYAPAGALPEDLPLPGQDNLGEKIQFLIDAGRLVDLYDTFYAAQELWRVDEYAADVTWMVSFDDTPVRTCRIFKAGQVFVHRESNSERSGHLPPEFTKTDFWSYVHAQRNVRVILERRDVPDPKLLKGSDAFMVFNLGAMYRTYVPLPFFDGEED